MNINTRLFGEITIDESSIIKFENGIPGFDNYKDYVLLNIEDSTMKALQSIEEKDVCLMVINPFEYFKEYEIELSDEEAKELEIDRPEDTLVYNVINIKKDKITVNLAAPIVTNIIKKLGKQIILSDNKYSIRQEIKCWS